MLPARKSAAGASRFKATDNRSTRVTWASRERQALAVINRDPRPKSGADRFTHNGLGLLELCWEGDAAEVVLLDIPGLKERTRVRIDRFRANSALAVKDGWIVVGDTRDDCRHDRHAAAYAVGNDGSVRPLWRDASPFDTFGRGIRKSVGVIEIVGYARRSIAIQEEATVVTDAGFQQETHRQRGLCLGRGLFRSLVRTGGGGTAGLRGRGLSDHAHGHGLDG